MVGSLLRGGAAGAVLAVAAGVGLASALAACASSPNSSPVGAAGGISASPSSGGVVPIPSGSASPSAWPASAIPSTVNPGGPMSTVPSPPATSVAQLVANPPAKSRYAPIEQESQSSDGSTLYLETEARGGACGQFVVVLQESPSAVRVGLAQLMPRVGVMCPMYIGPRTFTVNLPSPVGARPVIDLATGRPVR